MQSKLYLTILVLFIVIPQVLQAESFYLRNGEYFIATILQEEEMAYKVKREGIAYSFIHESSTIKKRGIYAVIDSSGALIFPLNLRLPATENPFKSLPDNEVQRYYYAKQIEQQAEINQNMKRIKTILFIQLILAAGAGAAVAIAQ